MTFAVGVLVGTLIGVVVTLAAVKVGDWLAWHAITSHLDDALAARAAGTVLDPPDARTLDAFDLFLDAVDRQQRARLRN